MPAGSEADMTQLAQLLAPRWFLIVSLGFACGGLSGRLPGHDGKGWEDEDFPRLANPLPDWNDVPGWPVTLQVNPGPASSRVVLSPGSAVVTEGGDVLVPLFSAGFSNVQSARFTLRWDPALLECVATEQWSLPGLGPAGLDRRPPGQLTLRWTHPSQGAVSLDSNTPLFLVRFRALGAPGLSTRLWVEAGPVPPEVVTVQGQALAIAANEGTIEVERGFVVTGAVTYRDTGVAVTDFAWQLAGGGPGAFGVGMGEGDRFQAGVPAQGVFRLGLAKTSDTTALRGISSVDLVLIRRHVLGLAPLDSPLALLAADADGSGTVSTVDLALLRRLILGQSLAVPAGTWRFVPSDPAPAAPVVAVQGWGMPHERVYENLDGPRSGQDFLAVKVGDVNGSWAAVPAPVAGRPAAARREGAPPLLAVASVQAEVQGEVTVAILATNFTAVQALQFSLAWDPGLLAYAGFTAAGLPGLGGGHVGVQQAAAGRLAVSWDDTTGGEVSVADGAALLRVHFTAGSKPGVSAVGFTDEPTPRELVRDLAAEGLLTLDGQVEIVDPGRPLLRVAALAGGLPTLMFSQPAGLALGIEYSHDLATWYPVWQPRIVVEGETARWTDDGVQTRGTAGRCYYRIVGR